MFETASSAVATVVQAVTFSLPLVGVVDLQRLALATIVFVGLTTLFWFIRMVVIVRFAALAKRTVHEFDDTVVSALQTIRPWVYIIVALYVSLQLFGVTGGLMQVFDFMFYTTVVWQIIAVAGCFINYFVKVFLLKEETVDEVDPNAATAASMITLLSKIALWAFGLIFVLSNMGIEVTSLVAGLGIGGIAIGFALQGILSDLFASFSLYFDKPFRVGDFITLGVDSGTVEKIGIKTTRLRTLQGEELVVSNSELTTARVQNFKKMQERRIVTGFGITYETPHEKLELVNTIVREIFTTLEKTRLDRTHFATLGDFSLNYEVVYHVETSNYIEFMDIQQQFNLELMSRLAAEGIEFAYPTQVVYHQNLP